MSSAPTLQRHSSISRYAAKAFSKFHFLCARNLTKNTWSIDDTPEHLKFRMATTHSPLYLHWKVTKTKDSFKSQIFAKKSLPHDRFESSNSSPYNCCNWIASSTKDHDVLVAWDSLTSLVSQPRWHVAWHPFHPRWDNWSHLHNCMFHSSAVKVPFGGSKTNALTRVFWSNKPKGENFFPQLFT